MKYSNTTPLPNNFLAEQGILNILLTNTSSNREVLLNLKAESFYFEPHKLIYEVISQLSEKNNPINITTVVTSLNDKNLLKKIGGIERIIIIINRFENFSNLDNYIQLVNEKYVRRCLIQIGKQTILDGYNSSEDIDTILEKVERTVFSLNQQKISNKIYTAAEIVNEIFLDMQEKIKKTSPSGLLTSFKDLDAILQGFQNSDLIIIAGRPSMGKTAFSLNLAKNIVEKYQSPLIIFTLEMSRQQIIYRFLSTTSNIAANRLRSGKMNPFEWKKLGEAMQNFSKLPIFIDDNPNLTLAEIRSKLRKIFPTKGKNGLVIIDYLQLMKANFKLENRVQEISYITRNLKVLAKEFEVPIIVLSQLSRNVESRMNKRPMLADLRESGCLASAQSSTSKIVSILVNSRKTFHSWNKTIIVNKKVLEFEFKGIKPTFIITFSNNVKLSLTSNHKILSNFGWIKVSELKRNTYLYCLMKLKNQETDLHYNFHEIKTIQYDGLKKVYDRKILDFHNYETEGYILHNSIEQDADIVIMLYRANYYNDNKNQDTQETEFIVAKHRNGPIGTATVLFKPITASFIDKNAKNQT